MTIKIAAAHRFARVALAFAALLGTTRIAHATDVLSPALAPATYTSSVDGTTYSDPGTYKNADAYTTITGTPPAVYTAGATTGFTDLFSELTYQFSVNGPADTLVPLQITYSLRTGGTLFDNPIVSFFNNTSQISFGVDGSTINACSASAGIPCSLNEVFTGIRDVPANSSATIETYVTSNTAYTVDLRAELQLSNASGYASADPSFVISPLFPDANQFSIQLSDGISNESISAIPLPPALPVFAAMLLGLGIAGQRGKDTARRET